MISPRLPTTIETAVGSPWVPRGLPRFTAESIPSMAPFPQGGSAVEDSNAVQPKLQTSAWRARSPKSCQGGLVWYGLVVLKTTS